MGQTSLRRSEVEQNGPSNRHLGNLSSDTIDLESFEETSVTAICDNYPFHQQTSYIGKISYTEEGMWDTGRTVSLDFELRDQSGLFILTSEVDLPVDKLIKEFNTAFGNDVRVYQNLTVNRQRLWDFLQSAEKILSITVLSDEGSEIEYGRIEDKDQSEVIGRNPIVSATVRFSYRDENIVARYVDGTLNVQSDWPEATEYIIQIFEREVLDDRVVDE